MNEGKRLSASICDNAVVLPPTVAKKNHSVRDQEEERTCTEISENTKSVNNNKL
jgi:hypothetical protein